MQPAESSPSHSLHTHFPATLTLMLGVCAVELFLVHFSEAPHESILVSQAHGLGSRQPPPAKMGPDMDKYSSVYCDEWIHLSGLPQIFQALLQRGTYKRLGFLQLKAIKHRAIVKKWKGDSCFTSGKKF